MGSISFSRSLTLAAVWESRSRLRGFAAAAGQAAAGIVPRGPVVEKTIGPFSL
jgi:hypothetical protein